MANNKATGYRLRMIALNWYIFIYCGAKIIEELGPYTHDEAQVVAANLGLQDEDRRVTNG